MPALHKFHHTGGTGQGLDIWNNSQKRSIYFQKKIQAYKQRLTQRTRENTGRLNTSTVLYQEREELEQKLDMKQKSLVC